MILFLWDLNFSACGTWVMFRMGNSGCWQIKSAGVCPELDSELKDNLIREVGINSCQVTWAFTVFFLPQSNISLVYL